MVNKSDMRLLLCVFYLSVMNVVWSRSADAELTNLRGEYLGQQPPGNKPEPFVPALFSVWSDRGFHLKSSVYFSPDGTELFFTNQTLPVVPGRSCSIWFMQQRDSTWTEPQIASFSSDYCDQLTHYAADGSRIFFVSKRPVDSRGAPEDSDIWYATRSNGGWAEPYRVDYPINTTSNETGAVLNRDGSMFFSSDRPGGSGGFDLYQTRIINGTFTEPLNLGESVNTGAEEHVVCAAPDVNFLIVYRVDISNTADAGLYITYREADGSWTRARSMGDHINGRSATGASVSPDGRYLFVLSHGNGIYWLKIDLIEYLKDNSLNISDTLIETLLHEGLEAALATCVRLREKHSDYVDVDELLLNQRGHQLLDANRMIEAIALFQISVALFPGSWNAFDSLGEAYLKARQVELAVQCYEQSLELNPNNTNAVEMLRKLRKE
ncbi:hypothetical protein AMJ83_02225 [candidate division WOR_3 bacterium SM23_42]|uniref:Uncharacterized protein n=1 Tax=candidate division WOR_3 bacterium SM23_42 TaxID=1703779 RepID=A0A0S8FY17_UNCW3|nr:MAG: hypothetical protein AMJ83_02225 [candidate division WOR_3 bacterium SM23_42]